MNYPIQITMPGGTTITLTPTEFDRIARSQGYVPAGASHVNRELTECVRDGICARWPDCDCPNKPSVSTLPAAPPDDLVEQVKEMLSLRHLAMLDIHNPDEKSTVSFCRFEQALEHLHRDLLPEQARELQGALRKRHPDRKVEQGPRYRVTDNSLKRHGQIGTLVYEHDGRIQLRFEDGWDATLSYLQMKRVSPDEVESDRTACYCSDSMSGGLPCPPGTCPNVPKVDHRPRCIRCGERWSPAEGEDATAKACSRCNDVVKGIVMVPCPTCGRQPFAWRPAKHESFCALSSDHGGACSWDPTAEHGRWLLSERILVLVYLCDGCAKSVEGCERQPTVVRTPFRCDLCERPRSARIAFKLKDLQEHWWNEGHGVGANSIMPA